MKVKITFYFTEDSVEFFNVKYVCVIGNVLSLIFNDCRELDINGNIVRSVESCEKEFEKKFYE